MEKRKANRKLKLVGAAAHAAWEFYRDPEGWRWRQVDGRGAVYKASLQAFRHLLECVANAKAEGYGPESDVRFVSWPA
jgi:hypothetical protein